MQKNLEELTPLKTVKFLDKYIIGQNQAKKSLSIALRNRWRRQLVDEKIKDEITPKNILMIGPTGVGKTEIARRISKLLKAPFIKVEASKFTEVGYVGRDVESIIRDLVEISFNLVKQEKIQNVQAQAEELAIQRIIEKLLPGIQKNENKDDNTSNGKSQKVELEALKKKFYQKIKNGSLNDNYLDIEINDNLSKSVEFMPVSIGNLDNLKDTFSNLFAKNKVTKKVKIKDGLKYFKREEAEKLIDREYINQQAVERVEQKGIVFIDEIDKVVTNGEHSKGDISAEGVQRDLLPIVEGSSINTKYGPVKTDFILFIAAGAFHFCKPSDMIPELQGRFPIRVELNSLTQKDFIRILKEPENSLLNQSIALLKTESVTISFETEAIKLLALIAYQVNEKTINIGARRLHTIIEKLLEEVSFNASEIKGSKVKITVDYVNKQLKGIYEDEDLSRYIL